MIERSGAYLCIGEVQKKNKCTYGQLPHHFQGTTPTFLALSGATQTGPNTFWTKVMIRVTVQDLFLELRVRCLNSSPFV